MNALLIPNGKATRRANAVRQSTPVEAIREGVFQMLRSVDVNRPPADQSLQMAWAALDALPLSTMEYRDFEKRILNAVSYARQNEFGAARYELVLLMRRLPKTRDYSG